MYLKKSLTYNELLNDVHYNKKDIDGHEVLTAVKQAGEIHPGILPFKGCMHVIDYAQSKHVAVGGSVKNFVSYEPQDFFDNGLGFTIEKFLKEDYDTYNYEIFPRIAGALKNITPAEYSDYIFSFTYRMKRSDGKMMQFYQQGSYVICPKMNLPIYGIAVITDISLFKNDSAMLFTIDKRSGEGGVFYHKNIYTGYFYPNPEEASLSKREKEILGRLSDGLSSKEIADRLFISESTIVNHRKSMLKKTNTKNVAELIAFGIRNHII